MSQFKKFGKFVNGVFSMKSIKVSKENYKIIHKYKKEKGFHDSNKIISEMLDIYSSVETARCSQCDKDFKFILIESEKQYIICPLCGKSAHI